MKNYLLRMSIVLVCLFSVTANGQAPQQSAASSPFAGRWEIQIQPPAGTSNPFEGGIPFAVIDVSGTGGTLSGKLVDSMIPGGKVSLISVKSDELFAVLEFEVAGQAQTMTIKAKRVGDHLEGTADPSGATTQSIVVGRATTADKVSQPVRKPPSADQKAFTTAMGKPRAERVDALKQFLKDYPDSSMKEQATLQLAQSYEKVEDRVAALQKYIEDFPKSADQGRLQIALAPATRADKAAGLRKFLDENPKSTLRERAEYELTNTAPAGAERLAAQETFVKAFPNGMYASQLYVTLLDSYAKAKPLAEPKLLLAIDGFLKGVPNSTTAAPGSGIANQLAGRLNTVADRLMANDVMLDKALLLIRQAVTAAGDKAPASSRAMYLTTLGQVLYKQKEYDQAERELKRSLEVAGAASDGEAQWYLGKIYEAKHDDAAALDAYFAAAQVMSNKDLKTSLEAAWTKKNGSLAGLEDKLDTIYKAKPKGFEPGHFVRKTEPGTPRVVLTELFTGAECGPCVAADMALDGVGERFDRQTVAVLVYHLHIPGPDPMTNTDTDARASYYSVNSTPTFLVDGAVTGMGGGGAAQAPSLFNTYKDKIETRLKETPRAALTGFKAKLSGQTLAVTGKAALAKAGTEKVKKATLRVALVQDMVRYVGANGVRFHTFVVRKLLGPAEGTALPAVGKSAAFSASIDVAKLVESLEKDATAFEAKRSTTTPFSFSDKVTGFKAGQTLLVAFVQDDDTKEILQAVFVKPA